MPTGAGAGVRLSWSRVDREVARRGYRRSAAYPMATVAGIFTNTVFGLLKGSILVAVLAHDPTVGGYDRADVLTFTWLSQALIMPMMFTRVWDDVALRIRSGAIATDLSRPIDPLRFFLADDLGRAWYQLLYRGVPPFVIGALLLDLRAPADLGTVAIFAVSLALAVITSFGFRFLYNCVAFWTLDIRGIGLLALLTATVLSGFLVPLTFFPAWLEPVARALPFAAMMQTPIDVFLGQLRGGDLVAAVLSQLAWGAGLLLLGRWVFARGAGRVVVQGG